MQHKESWEYHILIDAQNFRILSNTLFKYAIHGHQLTDSVSFFSIRFEINFQC